MDNIIQFKKISMDLLPDAPLFPLSMGRDEAGLSASLKRFGQLTPLIVQPNKGGFQLICGGRRLAALKRLGLAQAHCCLLKPEATPATVLLTAIEDNAGRGFNEAEKVLAVGHLVRFFEIEEIVRDHLDRLGIGAHAKKLALYRRLPALGETGLELLASGRLDAASGAVVAGLEKDSREVVMGLLKALNLSQTNRIRVVFQLVEVCRRDGINIAGLLEKQELKSIVDQKKLSPNDRTRLFVRQLEALRHPFVTQAKARQAELLKGLGLTPGLELTPSPNLEGLDFRLTCSFDNIRSLKELGHKISKLADDERMAELLEIG